MTSVVGITQKILTLKKIDINMATATLQKITNFINPDGYIPTETELRQHLLAVEKSPVITHSQFKTWLKEWRNNNL